MPNPILIVGSLCTLLATLSAQAPGSAQSRSEARADARADADRSSSRSSQTVTHRVVVINGKTVVDERTVDGKPAPAGPSGARPGGLPPMPTFDGPDSDHDVEAMLRRLREQIERELPKDRPPLPPAPGRGKLEPRSRPR